MATHTVNILDSKARCKDSYLHLLVKFWVNSKSPFQLEVSTEVVHELCYITHFFHCQTRVVLIVAVEVDREQNLL